MALFQELSKIISENRQFCLFKNGFNASHDKLCAWKSLVYRSNDAKSIYARMLCLNPLKSADLSKKSVKTRTLTPSTSQGPRVRTLKGGSANSLGQVLHHGTTNKY